MPLPTTDLTQHFDASVNTGLFKNLTGGLLADNPADGEQFTYWDDLIDTATDNSRVTMRTDGTTPSVRWRNDDVMPLPSVEIEDGILKMATQGGVGVGTAPPTNSAYTILLAFYIDSAGTYPNSDPAGAGQAYFNCTLVGGQRNTYSGVYIRKNGSDYLLYAYNYDGTADIVSYPITPDEPHVLCVRHEGGTLYFSVDCGAEVSVASGNTTSATAFYLGDEGVNSGTTADFRGRIGELAIFDVGLTGTDLTDATEYFCDRWLVPPTVTATSIFGEDCTVAGLSRVHALNLDGVTRTHSDTDLEGSVLLGGNLTLFEQASAPVGVANTGRIWVEDNGSGKTRLMVQFGTGSAVQIAIEP
jgi:hypothetical protein